MNFDDKSPPANSPSSLESQSHKQNENLELQSKTLVQNLPLILDKLSDIILIVNEVGEFTFASPNIESHWGYSPAEFRASSDIYFLIKDDRFAIEQLFNTEEWQSFESEIEDKENQKHSLLICTKRISIEDKKVIFICQDVSDRKKLERLMKQNCESVTLEERQKSKKTSEEKEKEGSWMCQLEALSLCQCQRLLTSIFEYNPSAIFLKDAKELKFIDLSRSGEAFLGCPQEELIGKTDREVFSEDIAESFLTQDRKVLEQHQCVEVTQKFQETEGVEGRTLLTKKVPIFDEAGIPQYIMGFVEDITEFKKLEQTLEESKATNRAILNTIPDMMLRFKKDRTSIDCKVANTFEPPLPQGELLGKKPEEMFPPDVAQQIENQIDRALKTQQVQRCEYSLRGLRSADPGRDRAQRADYEARIGICGKDEVLMFVRDISERKATETALRESENRFRAIFEQAAVGIVLCTLDGKLFRVNQTFCEFIDYSPEELRGRFYTNILHQDDRKNALAYAQFFLESKMTTFSMENRYIRQDGSVIWGNMTVSLIRSPSGEPQHLLGIVQDISDRVLAEAALRDTYMSLQEREEQYRTLTNYAPVGIFQANEKKEVTFVNPFWCEITNLSPEEAYGQKWMEAIHPEDRERAIAQWEKIPEERQENFEFRFQQSDGKVAWVATNSSSLWDKEGGYQGEIGTLIEITDRKQAEANLWLHSEQEHLINAIAQRIGHSLNLNKIINTTVQEVRQFLNCDRVIVYRFDPDLSGVVIAESKHQPWKTSLGDTIHDPCFTPDMARAYQNGRIQVMPDLDSVKLEPCYRNLLAQFQVKANLVVPILQGEKLWGLLIAHHCATPRQWQESEIKFLKQIATQVGIATQQSQLYEQLKRANHELHRMATIDGLTKIANRRCFDAYLKAEWRRTLRDRAFLSLILCDIDYFKNYNDTYRHQAGDRCLQQVATAIRDAIRRAPDFVARYGGEEFVAILPHTDREGALVVAETIRQAVKDLNIPHRASEISDRVTLSVGVATLIPSEQSSPQTLIDNADRALYLAKDQGRDRVVCF
ncbi:PAS domain S-box protein [Lusitaniella coriacea LEGE 07157]|uniref:PAS domain S-box protein n=1 Tax=Lusitaniella coriacea LEGE 07157 TaxID=945747 RepID=A0A8J7JFE6_9CYAN|nr:PAS domain S-box protein [Lusitaniella coriacea]MBE9118710.1 PAS domain S-box protein [Lusitaniella coriacea LEGE 07157]